MSYQDLDFGKNSHVNIPNNYVTILYIVYSEEKKKKEKKASNCKEEGKMCSPHSTQVDYKKTPQK